MTSRRSTRLTAVLLAALLALVGGTLPAAAAGTGTLSGTVVFPPGTTEKGSVSLVTWDRSQRAWTQVASASLSASPSFSFSALQPGAQYSLLYTPAGEPSRGHAPQQFLGGRDTDMLDPTAPQTFTATSGELVKNFTLHPGYTVKGRFVLPAEVTGEVKIERYRAYRYYVNGYERWEHHDYEDTVTLAADGSFTFTGVPRGSRIFLQLLGRHQNPKVEPWSSLGDTSKEVDELHVVTGDVTFPTVTLKRSVPVKGRIVADGEPVAGVSVYLYEIGSDGYVHQTGPTVTSAADGSFTFTQGAFEGRRYSFNVWTSGGPSGWPGGGKDSPEALTVEAGPNGIDFGTQDIVPNSTPKVPVEMLRLEGVPAVGSTLRLVTPDGRVGAPAAVPGATVEYRWFRDGVRITGATGPSYTPTPADEGHDIAAEWVARAPGYRAKHDYSHEVRIARGAAPSARTSPLVTGTLGVGATLKVSKGSWDVAGTKLSYQWLRDGKKIKGATKSSYTLTAKDKGSRITVRVTAKKSGHKTAKVVTKATAKVR